MKILIADDHSLFRAALPGVLNPLTGGTAPIEAATVDEAAAHLSTAEIDLVLLDLFMPGMNGVAGLHRLTQLAPTVPIMVVTASASAEDATATIAAGAAAYVTKATSPETLLAAIQAVVEEGETPVIGVGSAPEAHTGPLARLTPRQRDVATLVAQGRSNREIAESLSIAEGTVKLHVASILKTLGARRRSELASRLAAPRQTF